MTAITRTHHLTALFTTPAPQAKWNVLAIIGFALSFLVGLPGLICSIIGFNQTKRSGEKGRGLALAGIIISAVNMLLALVLTKDASAWTSAFDSKDDYFADKCQQLDKKVKTASGAKIRIHVQGVDGNIFDRTWSADGRVD